jgi:hypothetical protein
MESQAIQKLSLVVISYLDRDCMAGDIARPERTLRLSAIGMPHQIAQNS